MTNNNEAKKLLLKYKEGECTPEEIAIIESWYLYDEMEDNVPTLEDLDSAKSKIWADLPVHQTIKTKQVKLWRRYSAAAAIVALSVSVGLYFMKKTPTQSPQNEIVVTNNNHIIPGGKKAILTLANGKSISLNEAENGKLAIQSGSNVFKTESGEIVYNAENGKTKQIEYNQITIPKGGYFTIVLSDGTKIWLNSESSLRYPTDFTGAKRVVELSGEAYFEVAKRKDQPFNVVTDKQTVEVLGTHFNINAYANEKMITTTLLEGSVNVISQKSQSSAILKPGQQATLRNAAINITTVNTEDAVAWVNNNFNFNNEDLGSIMRKISRWYDVDVICPPEFEELEFIGTVSRSKNINDVIKIIESTKAVHLKVEGRRITVMH